MNQGQLSKINCPWFLPTYFKAWCNITNKWYIYASWPHRIWLSSISWVLENFSWSFQIAPGSDKILWTRSNFYNKLAPGFRDLISRLAHNEKKVLLLHTTVTVHVWGGSYILSGDVPLKWLANSASCYNNDPLIQCKNWYKHWSYFQNFLKLAQK